MACVGVVLCPPLSIWPEPTLKNYGVLMFCDSENVKKQLILLKLFKLENLFITQIKAKILPPKIVTKSVVTVNTINKLYFSSGGK